MRAVVSIPVVGLIAGAALGTLAPGLCRSLALIVMLASVVGAIGGWRRAHAAGIAGAVAVGFFIGGILLSEHEWHARWRPTLRVAFDELAARQRAAGEREGRRLPEDGEAFVVVEGTLRSDAAPLANGVSLSVSVDAIQNADSVQSPESPASQSRTWRSVSGGVVITVAGSLAADYVSAWRAGRRVRVPLQLHRPSRYLDPAVPDSERALARRGTTLVATAKSGALVEVIARGGIVDEGAASARAFVRRAIGKFVAPFSTRSAGIVAAIVIGDRAGLDDGVERSLQDAGTYHVIAISGGNIAILAGLLLTAFRLAGFFGRTAMASAAVALVAYEYLVGGGASVDRATLTAVAYLGARMLDQQSTAVNTLMLVAGCLVAAEPLAVLDPALILTCGATLAIVTATPLVRTRTIPPVLAPVVLMATASAATEAMLLPVGALAFSRVTFAGLLLNFAAIPLMAIVQVAGMLLVPAALLSDTLASALGRVAHVAAACLVRSADLVQVMPALVVRVAPPAGWVVALYYAGLAVAASRWGRARLRWLSLGATGLAAVWIVAEPWTVAASRGDGRLHLTFIDVGQGDATFVRFPRGAAILIDAGGLGGSSSFDIGDRVVAPVLREAGVRRLEALALTHGDPDHIGGAPSIVREFHPRAIWEGIPVPPFEPLRALRADAAAMHAAWINVKTGDSAWVDDVAVLVRHPDLPDWERQRVRNDDSIVLELRWRNVSVLLTGDIGRAVERGLPARIPAAPIRIVKIPHHGSLTSSTPELVQALAPTIAVVSAGRSNHFGHPVPEVLQRYRDAGAEVFRTDQDGAVMVDTDGTTVEAHSFVGEHRLVKNATAKTEHRFIGNATTKTR